MKTQFFCLFVIILFFSYSCRTPKDISYFQDLDERAKQLSELSIAYQPIIQTNDVLLITVAARENSNPELSAPFNMPLTAYLTPGDASVQTSSAVQTYTVDSNGYINYPVIGQVKLVGLTLDECTRLIAEKVSESIPDPIVNISILSYQVSVLGEVNKPGVIPVTNNRMSILDAIAAAEDLTIWGNRKNVLLVRDANGKKEYVRFDLTQSDIFSSPYFYLRQNDVLIVDANNTKKRESKQGTSETFKLSTITTILAPISTLSTLILTINTIENNKNNNQSSNKD
jgi:Periplasmic protein involved in polysaccharide export